jgi:hypothetical protein
VRLIPCFRDLTTGRRIVENPVALGAAHKLNPEGSISPNSFSSTPLSSAVVSFWADSLFFMKLAY